ncbi:MAG TPA: CoA-binding protein [Alphaproteobacteria bacterium]|nr:CoA-binding protein [Alphaproteobacteria bacterium]
MSDPTDREHYSDDYLLDILKNDRVIAMVGASPNWNRPSYFAMKYLQGKGYRVIPVNPVAVAEPILGEKVYASLKDIPVKVDIVDIFRKSEAVPPIVDDAIAIGAKVVWMQLGVRHPEAAAKAERAGIKVVMNRCIKIEFGRLSGELSWSGINSGIISSKRRKLLA